MAIGLPEPKLPRPVIRNRQTNPIADRLRRLIGFLGSGHLAVMLLVATSCILYLYLVIPQVGQLDERELLSWVERKGAAGRTFQALGFTDLLHSWLFWAVYGLLLVNLSVCMTRRLALVVRLCRFPESPPEPGSGWIRREVDVAGMATEQVARTLRSNGYRSRYSASDIYALRGRFASIGHWVFHAGLLAILLIGGSLAAAPPPFGGSVGVGEGEPFDLHQARFVSSNQAVDPELPPLRFRVDRVGLHMEPQGVKGSQVDLTSPEGSQATIAINQPYRSGPFQVLVHGFGFMPGWVVVNLRGHPLGSAWLKLLPYPLVGEDSFPLGSDGSTVFVRFYPDHQLENGQDRNLSQELRNPRFRTRVVWRGEEVYAGLLSPGARVPLEPGKEFFFLPEVRKYALLDVIEERGQAPVFACFGVMIVGLLLRYGRIRKEIVVRVRADSLELFGRGEIFEHLFAEDMDRLAQELVKENAAPAAGGGNE
jgi:hypothetical protein